MTLTLMGVVGFIVWFIYGFILFLEAIEEGSDFDKDF